MKMKITKKLITLALAAVLLMGLLSTAFAANDSRLSAFVDSKQYSDGTFSDVSAAAWYSSSVKTVYEKGIMDGTGGGQFAPQSTIPWAQAVTIAARLHSTYHGKSIPAADGPWYVQYLDYARENGLLPEICPDDAETASTPITREGLAVLFRSVLDEADLPAINDQSIPDIGKVQEKYRNAVSEMFASGIFTGTNGGLFDPDGQATRAQVATIVARLLCPGQRVSHDSRQNSNMADQMGNLYNGGIAARNGDTVYYVHCAEQRDDRGEYSRKWSIFARDDDGQIRQVYSSVTDYIELLSVGSDGLLYFVQRDNARGQNVLTRLNPETGKAEAVYSASSGAGIGFYLFYDGQLYIYESSLDSGKIGRVNNGRMTVLATMSDWGNLYVDDTMYCFGGKLCWLQLAPKDTKGDDHFMILDLETGKTTSIATKASDFAYQGATVWSMEYANNDKSIILKRFSLAMPDVVETVATYSGEYVKLYSNLYANGSQLYYQVSGAKKLWTISSTGQTEVAATARTEIYEASAVTSQGIVMLGIESFRFLSSDSIDVITPDGKRTNLCAFLNQPYVLEGADQLAATDDQVFFDAPTVHTGEFNCYPLRAFTTADGDLALEYKIINNTREEGTLAQIKIELSNDAVGTSCFACYYVTAPNQSREITLVLPKGTVELKGNLSELDITTDIYGSWKET